MEDDQSPLSKSHSPPSAIAMEGTSSFYFPTTETALNTISECIHQLLQMQHIFFCLSLGDTLSHGKSVDGVQEEVLRIKCSVVCLIEELIKETEEGGQTPPLASFHFPTTRTAFSAISVCIKKLVKMQHVILQMAVSLSQGESVDKEQLDVLRIKSSVVRRLETIFKDSEEEAGDDEAMDVESYDSDDYVAASFPEEIKKPWLFNKKEFTWSSSNETEETKEKERYLCVSNGYEIWCLDLKRSLSYPPDLPKIASLSLLGEQLPASVGLFKLGSNAYMIGGQDLPASLKEYPNTYLRNCYGKHPKGLNLYICLCHQEGVKGSSRVTYGLSLAADKENNSTLSLSHHKADIILELNKPKVWAIVEKIGNKLHVMDSKPFFLPGQHDWTFTHEVCNLDGSGGGWNEIVPTIEEKVHITSHVVVGDRIYAVTHDGSKACNYLVFDSQTGKWEGCASPRGEPCNAFKLKRVWQIVSLGFGRCVGEFGHVHREGEGEKPSLYVIVALVQDFGTENCGGTLAVAYLVTLTGQVVCYQRLPHFFTGPLQPRDMISGTMICVEEDEEGPARTMCSVVNGTLQQERNFKKKDYLFVNTFSVELLNTDAVERVLVEKASEVEVGYAVEQEFVRVVPKDWYVYKTDAKLKSPYGDYKRRFVSWRACFLTPVLPNNDFMICDGVVS